MPTPVPPGFSLGIAEPKDAIAAFRQRKLLELTFGWEDLWNEEHTRAFTISRLAETDLLAFIQAELDKAIAKGTSLADWSETVQARLEQAGWWGRKEVVETSTGEVLQTVFNPARLELIFEVNVRQAQAAGRWQRIERSKKTLPLVIYRTMRDERVRKSHAAWDGVVLPVDDPWWDTHFPPCGWRCRCTAYAIDEGGVKELSAAGIKIQRKAPHVEWVDYINKRTGESSRVPAGVDPGFGYNPGKFRPQLG